MIRRTLRSIAVVAAVAAVTAGCTARVHYPRDPGFTPRHPVPALVAGAEFAYERRPAFTVDRIEEETANFRIMSLSMRASGENGQPGNLVTARFFHGRKGGARPLVIILPIWGVHTLPSNALADQIRTEGRGAVDILQVHGERMLFDLRGLALAPTPAAFRSLMDRMADRVVDTVIDIRRMVDWAAARPQIDRRRIALVGFSIGAVVASLALANEPRLSAGVLIMGGAKLDDAFATCDGAAGKMRALVTRRFNWSVERFRREIKPPLDRLDPVRFAGRVDPRRVLIIEAGEDTCLPASGRRRFWEAMGRPERIVYRYDHRASFMAMTVLGGGILQKEAFGFLTRVLGVDAGAVAAH